MTSALSSRVSATTSSLRTQRVQKRQSASFKCNAYDEAEIDKRYPQGGSVYKVTLDCSTSNISLGLLLKPGEDGRPVVRTVRPGGKALGKVQVGDCILATSYVELGNVSEKSWGSVQHGWCDTAEVTYDQANAAMTTNTNKISMILDSDYKPASGPKAVTSTNSEDAKAWAKKKSGRIEGEEKQINA